MNAPRDPSFPPDGTVKTRGLNPLGVFAWVRHHHGRPGLEKLLKELDPEDLEILSGGDDKRFGTDLAPHRWYPFALHCRLLRAVDSAFGEGDFALLHDVGSFMAQRDLPRIFLPLVRMGRPGWIFRVATRLWRYYHSHGEWRLERTPVSIIATLHDVPESDEAFCATFVGWMSAALELCGAKDIDGGHPACAGRGAPRCVFTVRWTGGRGKSSSSS
jgi:hypothetical protein